MTAGQVRLILATLSREACLFELLLCENEPGEPVLQHRLSVDIWIGRSTL